MIPIRETLQPKLNLSTMITNHKKKAKAEQLSENLGMILSTHLEAATWSKVIPTQMLLMTWAKKEISNLKVLILPKDSKMSSNHNTMRVQTIDKVMIFSHKEHIGARLIKITKEVFHLI